MDPYAGSYDFMNPQSFNRYTYAFNNPLRFKDPSGLCSTTQTVTVYADGSQGNYTTSALACGFWDAVEVVAGAIAAGFADLGNDVAGLFGFGHASFKGSIKPRPSVASSGMMSNLRPDFYFATMQVDYAAPSISYMPSTNNFFYGPAAVGPHGVGLMFTAGWSKSPGDSSRVPVQADAPISLRLLVPEAP